MSNDQLPEPPVSATVGSICNVNSGRHNLPPKMRLVLSAGWKKKPDGWWYCWTWKPLAHSEAECEGTTLRTTGSADCGFSGIHADLITSEREVTP